MMTDASVAGASEIAWSPHCDQPDLLPRLFDRFAKSEGSDGIGLGLHLAQQIAKPHGGTLEVRSSLGAGTTFRLLLPVDGAAR